MLTPSCASVVRSASPPASGAADGGARRRCGGTMLGFGLRRNIQHRHVSPPNAAACPSAPQASLPGRAVKGRTIGWRSDLVLGDLGPQVAAARDERVGAPARRLVNGMLAAA